MDIIVTDFKLGSYFSLWKAVPNMTLTLNSLPKVKILETPIKKISHNMLGYYAQGIIYCWRGQRSRSTSSKRSNSLDNFASNCHRDFKISFIFLVYEKQAPNMTWTLIFDLDKLAKGQNFWNITIKENLSKYAWILCVRHNLLLAELCALRARCLLFQMLSIIVSTPSGSFKADRPLLVCVRYIHWTIGPDFLEIRYKHLW